MRLRRESGESGERIEEITLKIPYPDTFIYSNIAAFSMSLMDIRIAFGEALPEGGVAARVGVVMTPEHAAILTLMLLRQVNSYEVHFGKIRHPEWRHFADRAEAQAKKDEDPKVPS